MEGRKKGAGGKKEGGKIGRAEELKTKHKHSERTKVQTKEHEEKLMYTRANEKKNRKSRKYN